MHDVLSTVWLTRLRGAVGALPRSQALLDGLIQQAGGERAYSIPILTQRGLGLRARYPVQRPRSQPQVCKPCCTSRQRCLLSSAGRGGGSVRCAGRAPPPEHASAPAACDVGGVPGSCVMSYPLVPYLPRQRQRCPRWHGRAAAPRRAYCWPNRLRKERRGIAEASQLPGAPPTPSQ